MIASKKFEDYFFVLSDLIRHAKKKMLVGPARGSSAGSLVCYLIDITDVDPIKFDLIFERFIDVTREDLPDIDVDFPDSKRISVMRYLKSKYGKSCFGHIGTISEYKPRSALGELGKKMNIPFSDMNDLKNTILERSSGDARAAMCIADTFTTTDLGKEMLEKYPQLSLASKIEGHVRHHGKHAAGLVVLNDDVRNYASMGRKEDEVIQLDKKDAEYLNILKIDALGLRTLSVISDCLEQINMKREQLLDLSLEDKEAFDVLNKGHYSGIFQFEGYALQSLTKQMPVEKFDDIVAITTLARPGPLHSGGASIFINRRTAKEPVTYLHDLAIEDTKDTYGVIIYQEQVMQIGRKIGKLSWEDVSNLRKAMSKSLGEEFFNAFWEKFKAGAAENAIEEKDAKQIWESMCTFGSWAFNKCISGACMVRMGATGGSTPQWMSIEDLHEKYVANPTSWTKTRMPVLQSLYPDGRVRPQKVKRIFKNGKKDCYKFTFADGSFVECTKDHKFIINGKWIAIGKANIGDGFSASRYEKQSRIKIGHPAKGKKYKKSQEGFAEGADNPSYINGKTKSVDEFRELMKDEPCQETGEFHPRMEIHHNDFNEGYDRPEDLAWLTPSAHKKRHYANNRKKRWGKGHEVYAKKLISIEHVGMLETYDIEMEEHHNYVIDGGIITHNSHAVSYGMISYWCAWLKAHYPLEYAAACLRNSKDDDQTIKTLRELVKEGFEYIPLDMERSMVNWTVQKGKLVGGLSGVKGVGIKTAENIIMRREQGLELMPGQLKRMANPIIPYSDVFECQTKFGKYYDDPELINVQSGKPISYIEEIGNGKAIYGDDGSVERYEKQTFVFIGKLKEKNLRDLNEYGNLVKRGGEVIEKNNLFLNLVFEDDTDKIICTIGRFQYEEWGKEIVETGKIDSFYLIKGDVKNGWRKIYVSKIKLLEEKGK